MNKQAWSVAKLNLRNITVPYIITGIISAVIFVQSIIYLIISLTNGRAVGQQVDIGVGNYSWVLIIIAAIFVPLVNFRKTVNLGGKRNGFFWGGMYFYIILALLASLWNIVFYYTYERLLMNTGYYAGVNDVLANMSLMETNNTLVNLMDLFGWMSHGAVLAFFQQFAFLFLLAAAVHTLVAAQDSISGWIADGVIAAVLGIFIPIAPLRAILLKFFDLVIFNSNAFLQTAVCFVLALIIYSINIPILARKRI